MSKRTKKTKLIRTKKGLSFRLNDHDGALLAKCIHDEELFQEQLQKIIKRKNEFVRL